MKEQPDYLFDDLTALRGIVQTIEAEMTPSIHYNFNFTRFDKKCPRCNGDDYRLWEASSLLMRTQITAPVCPNCGVEEPDCWERTIELTKF
jgi:ribosomal protein S27AE